MNYTDVRPSFFEAQENWNLDLSPSEKLDLGTIINDRLLGSKSTHWGYEEELRMAIPWEVKDGDAASFNKFHSNELTELYFGCRMQDDVKGKLLTLAKSVNPSVSVFQTVLVKDSYALTFEQIA